MEASHFQRATFRFFGLCLITFLHFSSLAQESEPNNTAAQANTFNLNTTIEAALNPAGDEDWFKITIPQEGILRIVAAGISINDFYIRLLDVDGSSVLATTNVYPLGEIDSVQRTNLSAGTYYLRVYPFSSSTGQYRITNKFIAALLPNDTEPNNSYETAQLLNLNAVTTGRINYGNVNGFDTEDWYKVSIPEEGTLKFISTSPDNNDYYIRMYDVNGSTVFSTSNVYPLGETDSVLRTNLQAGIYYLLVYPFGSNHGSYHLRNVFIPATLPNDPEPNNTVEQAAQLLLETTVTGRLNYVYNGTADANDWYYIDIPDDGHLKLQSTSPDMNDYYLRLIDANGTSVLQTSNIYPLGETDSVFKKNLQAGRYFTMLYPFSTNHGSYYLNSSFTPALFSGDPEPNNTMANAIAVPADTSFTGRLNYGKNNVFDTQDWFAVTMPQAGGIKVTSNSPDNRDYYLRIFGPDGTTQLASVNVYNYVTRSIFAWNLSAGTTYYVRLDAFSSNFGSYNVSIEFQPAPQPAFNFSQQLMKVLFNNNSQYGVSYSWNFGDGTSSTKVNPSHTYTAPGVYEVKLTATNPNGSNTYTDFVEFRGIQKVEGTEGGSGTKVTVSVFAGGLSQQSIPKLVSGSLVISGTGIVFPKPGEIQAVFDLVNAPLGMYDVVVSNPGQPDMILPQAYKVAEASLPDVFVQVNGRDRALLNRWSTYNISFGNRGNTDAYYQLLWIAVPDSVEFKNLIFDAGLFPDPEVQAYVEGQPPYWEIDTLGTVPFKGRLYGIQFQRIPAGYTFDIELRVKAVENFEIAAFTTSPWFDVTDFPKTMSYNECVAWAMAIFLRDKLIEQLTGLIPGADCIYSGVKTLSELTLAYSEGKLRVTTLGWGVSQVVWNCLKSLGENIPFVKAMKISKIMIDITVDMVNSYNADTDCQQYKIKTVVKKQVAAVTSLDPNEIVGPGGFGEQRHIKDPRMDYTIYFENMQTATSNAVEVFVYDTLNPAVYDLASFRFGNIWISGNLYTVIPDGNTFALDVDLRPALNTIVRVRGEFKPAEGTIFWHFMSLDPATLDITEDPEAGFLPPNNNKPEGEGYVSYSLDRKASLTNGAMIDAVATIVFDFNEPIVTNTFVNAVDLQAPVSSVYQIRPYNSELHEVLWQGSDQGAGVAYYNIFMAEGDGPFTLWKNHTIQLSDTIRANPNTFYRFFAQAVDQLGNTEAYKDYAEQILGVDDFMNPTMALRLIPNPARNTVKAYYVSKQSGTATLKIYNSLGELVVAHEMLRCNFGENEQLLDISTLKKGIYQVVLHTMGTTTTTKLIVW